MMDAGKKDHRLTESLSFHYEMLTLMARLVFLQQAKCMKSSLTLSAVVYLPCDATTLSF